MLQRELLEIVMSVMAIASFASAQQPQPLQPQLLQSQQQQQPQLQQPQPLPSQQQSLPQLQQPQPLQSPRQLSEAPGTLPSVPNAQVGDETQATAGRRQPPPPSPLPEQNPALASTAAAATPAAPAAATDTPAAAERKRPQQSAAPSPPPQQDPPQPQTSRFKPKSEVGGSPTTKAANSSSSSSSSQQLFGADEAEKNAKFQTVVVGLCKNRPPNEYFRLSAESSCRDAVRCVQNDFQGGFSLAAIRCPSGLSFDLTAQTCDWAAKVTNCNELTKPRLVRPNFKTAEPVCPKGQLQCGDGTCIDKALFCDGNAGDCKDGSDETACSADEDPNAAPKCDPSACALPDCFCSADGTKIPGDVEVTQTPQMITITFNGAVTGDNVGIYQTIFRDEFVNPNGCSIKGTFFVSHKYTNYSAVQELHRKGHEIGVFSISNKDDPKYWSEGSYDEWLAEMAGDRLIVERFANISDGSVIGMRAPYLRVGKNAQFQMMNDQFFVYDASIVASLSRVPVWPYTLTYRMPHKCHGNANNCPTRSQPIWELPINELDRRDDPTFDERLSGCSLVSSCSNVYEKEQFQTLLETNFNRHYSTNRAPLSLSFDAGWLQVNKGFAKVLADWIKQKLASQTDVYFVTELQVIQWMQHPLDVNSLRDNAEWKVNCAVSGQPFCSLPNACPLTTRELPGETLRLFTCMECPNNYPWLLDPTGDGAGF